MNKNSAELYKTAFLLSLFTIIYNLAEGLLCTIIGYNDETLALFGFGMDSFIEMLSGSGILMMVLRIRKYPESGISQFEINALKITGWGFYLLSAGLAAGIVLSIIQGHRPESTFWGTIITSVSVLVMAWLYIAKRKTGKKLDSEPILADASCTLVCIYMSVAVLFSSAVNELTGFAYADLIGVAGLIWFSVSEGREAMEKARKRSYLCCNQVTK